MRHVVVPLMLPAALVTLVGSAAPAGAEEGSIGSAEAGLPAVSLDFMPHVTDIAAEHEWCASGSTRYGSGSATWVVTLTAIRSDGTSYAPPPRTFSAPTMSTCYRIPKNGTLHGDVAITLTFTAVGGDITMAAEGDSHWTGSNDTFQEWHN